MTIRRAIVLVAAGALIACGGGEEKKDEAGKDKPADGVSKLSGETSDESPKPGGDGDYAKTAEGTPGNTGPTKSLFGGRFKGIFKKKTAAAPAKQAADLTQVLEKSAKPSMTPVAASPVAGTGPAKAAGPIGQTEGLWGFAPANAAVGAVLADGTLLEIAAALSSIKEMISQAPMGNMILGAIAKDPLAPGLDIFDLTGWASKAGVDISSGIAVFASVDGDVVVVLPITDPAAFQKAIQDDEGNLGDKHCVMAKPGRYVCGENLASAQAAAKPHSSALAKRVARLPSWLRGDIEVVAHLASFEDAMKEMADLRKAMQTIGLVAVAANLDNGALSVRGWLEGKRGGPVGQAFAAIPDAKLISQSAGATNFFHFRLPMGLLTKNIPAGQVPPPVQAGLIDNLTGEIVTYSRGKSFLSEMVVFGLKDGSKTAQLIDMACGEIAKAGLVQKLKQKPGMCAGVVDLGKALASVPELAPFVKGMPAQPVGVRVTGNSLEMMFGRPKGPSGKAGELASSGVGREIVTGNWNGVFWGLATDPLAVAPKALQQRLVPVLKSLPPEVQLQVALGRWVYGHMYDAGAAFALRDDGMYMLAEISTFAGDSPAAYADHQKGLKLLLAHDLGGYKRQIKANAATHRGTMTGTHAAAVSGGAPILGQLGIWGVAAGAGAWMGLGKKKDVSAPAVPALASPKAVPAAPTK